MKKLIILILAAISAMSGNAQTLTLDDCRRMAIEQNAKMKTANNELSEAQMDKKEAFTGFFPSLSLSGGGMKAKDALLQMEMGPGQKMELINDGLFGAVNASLPIYAGGRIYNGYKLAKLGVEIKELQLLQNANEASLTVEQYFWNIVILEEKLRTLKSVEDLLENTVRDVDNAVNAGIRTRNDLLQAQLRQNETRSSRMDMEDELKLCKMLLAQYIGMGESDIEIAFSMNSLPVAPETIFVDHHEALYSTNEYRLLSKDAESAKLQKRISMGEFLPTVAIGGSYLYNDLMGASQNSLVGFVSVSIPISWGAPYRARREKYNYKNAVIRLNDGSEQLIIRMQQAKNKLVNAFEQILIARKSIEQSEENLRLSQSTYDAGTSTMSDLLDAQSLFQKSRDKYAEAYATYEIKKTEYLQTTGRNRWDDATNK